MVSKFECKIIIPNGTTYNIKSITIKYLEETLIVTTIEDKIFTYDINDIRNIITHDNIYTLDFLDNDDLSFESNVEPDDLRITSISFENILLNHRFHIKSIIQCETKH